MVSPQAIQARRERVRLFFRVHLSMPIFFFYLSLVSFVLVPIIDAYVF